jgi:hypothetical protein
MTSIREIVQQTLNTGYLSLEAENQLRCLLKAKPEVEEVKVFATLQYAAAEGQIRQQSRELIRS